MIGLRDFTAARVALKRAGQALATSELLDFQLAHALARDAVHAPFDAEGLLNDVRAHGWRGVIVQSAAQDRAEYLKTPWRGRLLSEQSRTELSNLTSDVIVVIADGLSALAAGRHAMPLLSAMNLGDAAYHFVARQARVALGDVIGELCGSSLSLVLIGERPGLSAPDSLGAYLTWSPRAGRTDAERFCVSNIRTGGLTYEQAAARILFLMSHAREMQMTGTGLGGIRLLDAN